MGQMDGRLLRPQLRITSGSARLSPRSGPTLQGSTPTFPCTRLLQPQGTPVPQVRANPARLYTDFSMYSPAPAAGHACPPGPGQPCKALHRLFHVLACSSRRGIVRNLVYFWAPEVSSKRLLVRRWS